MIAFVLILLIALVPETKYNRRDQEMDVLVISTAANEETGPQSEKEMPTAEQKENRTLSKQRKIGRPTMKQYNLIQPPSPHWRTFLLRNFVVPVRIAFYPIVLFAGLNFSGPANLYLFWNLIESSVLGGPPYTFTTAQVGYSNFAVAIGALIGLAVVGPFSEWVSRKLTIRNGGVHEAEMRLPALIPPFILTVLGTVLAGIAVEREWPWPSIVVPGLGIAGFCFTTVSSITIGYAVDAYKPVTGEIMVVATVIKNTCGFTMTYWIPPLAAREGYLTALMVWFTFTIGPMVLAIPFYVWGKRLRKTTRNSSVHLHETLI